MIRKITSIALSSFFAAAFILMLVPHLVHACDDTHKEDQSRPKVERFNYLLYDHGSLKKFADEHFPVGTPRSYIDDILVKQGHAKANRRDNKPAPKLYSVVYDYPLGDKWDCHLTLEFVFDRHDETVYIAGAGPNFVVQYLPFRELGGCSNAL
jgi:hypothetical protein